jgi:hypothetical protein
MQKVFLSGSRKIKTLPQAVKERVDNIIGKGFQIVVGDANGADKAFQTYLETKHYNNVIVFCMNSDCRNNVGNWDVKPIHSNEKKKDFKFYSTKDEEMAKVADFGLMVWDLESNGTFNNIYNLASQNKSSVVYIEKEHKFHTIKDVYGARELLNNCSTDIKKNIVEKIGLNKINDNISGLQISLI